MSAGSGASGQGSPGGYDPSDPGDRAGSIIERFRGTEWDSQPNLPPPPPSSGSGISAVLVVAGLVLLLAVGGGSAVLLGSKPTPPPSFPIVTNPPIPTKAPGEDVIAAFWTVVDDFDVSYHLETSGSLSTKASDLRFAQKWTMALDIAADNYVGKLAITGRGTFTWDRFDGTIYLKKAGTSTWEKTPTSDRSFRQSPFLALDDHREIAYAGTVEENGRTLHKLVGTEAYRPSIARMFALAWFEFPFTAIDEHFELFVTEAGVPVRATFRCSIRSDPEHAIPGFSGSAKFTFSAFGQGPKITAAPTR